MLRVGRDCGGGAQRHRRDSENIRPPVAPVNMEIEAMEIEAMEGFLGHHVSATFRAARRRRPGPQARAAGRSAAKSLDDAEHRSTLTDVMAESAHVIIAERVLELPCDAREIAAAYARQQQLHKRRADHAHNCNGWGHRHGGVSNPQTGLRRGQSAKSGGLLTPPLHQRHRLSAFHARHRTPRSVGAALRCKSATWRGLPIEALVRRPVRTFSFAPPLSVHGHGQPPLFVAAPLAASTVPG